MQNYHHPAKAQSSADSRPDGSTYATCKPEEHQFATAFLSEVVLPEEILPAHSVIRLRKSPLTSRASTSGTPVKRALFLFFCREPFPREKLF